tara:strand:+ start:116 stop:262 length:147 start_codon:yes stop_codon:yes gene_type:complete
MRKFFCKDFEFDIERRGAMVERLKNSRMKAHSEGERNEIECVKGLFQR